MSEQSRILNQTSSFALVDVAVSLVSEPVASSVRENHLGVV